MKLLTMHGHGVYEAVNCSHRVYEAVNYAWSWGV